MSGSIRLIAAMAVLVPALSRGDPPRVLFYPSALRAAPNLLEGAKWMPPSEKSEKDSRAAKLQGGPFRADEPAYEVESFAPESAYWRTHAKVSKGHKYLVGAWVKFASAKVLFWCNGRRIDGKPFDQRLYCFSGFQAYLTPYFSEPIRRRLGGSPDEWRLMFRTLEYPEALVDDSMTIAVGLYMTTGKMAFAAPFLVDVTDAADTSLLIDIADVKPIRKLMIEHVGVRDAIWQKDFPKGVTDFMEAVPSVTDFRRGMDARNQIDGHALNVYYVDGSMTKVFAPLEHVCKHR